MSVIFRIPIIGTGLGRMNEDIAKLGLQPGMKNVFLRTQSKLIVEFRSQQSISVLENDPVVVVANHPHDADIVALLAGMPKRDNAYLVMSAAFFGVCPALDLHAIPVYIDHHKAGMNEKNIRRSILYLFNRRKRYSPSEEQDKNRESIREASKKLAQGALVIIFPGKGSGDGHWYSGVGHMLSGVKNKQNIHIVFAHIRGTGERDYLRFFPLFHKVLAPIDVSFSEPHLYTKLVKGDVEPKQIAATLEEKYHSWAKPRMEL